MKIEFDIFAGPPSCQIVEQERERQERLFPLVVIALVASFFMGALAYFKLWGAYPDWQFALEIGLSSLGIFAVVLLLKLAPAMRNQANMTEAHPVTAHAYLESSSNPLVKMYCIKALEQGRNLTMAEAAMLLKHCTSGDEIVKLAAYYEKHAPLADYKGSIFILPPP